VGEGRGRVSGQLPKRPLSHAVGGGRGGEDKTVLSKLSKLCTITSLVPRLCLGMQAGRLCLPSSDIEAEPLERHSLASAWERGNRGLPPYPSAQASDSPSLGGKGRVGTWVLPKFPLPDPGRGLRS